MSVLPNKERQEELFHQVILTYENDGKWYSATAEAVEQKDFRAFRNITNAARLRIFGSSSRFRRCSPDENCWINLQLWKNRAGSYPTEEMIEHTTKNYQEVLAELTQPPIPNTRAEREKWLIDNVVTPLSKYSVWQERAAKRFTPASFRQHNCRYFSRYLDQPHLYGLSCEDRNFIHVMLWKASGRPLTRAFAKSQNARTTAAILTIFEDHPELVDPDPESQEQEIMNENTVISAVAFETKHYVYGRDVDNLSEGQLIDSIKKIENEITDLKGIKTKSKRIAAKVAELEAMLAKVVEVLDAK